MSDLFIPPDMISDGPLLIRSYQPGDGAPLAVALEQSYEHLKPWMPWAQPQETAEDCEVRIRGFRGKYLLGDDFILSIWMQTPGGAHFVGGTGFHRFNMAVGSAEIGMWIAGPWAGKGWATRTLRLLLRWGFSAWPWQRLHWRCDTLNHASARTAESAGLRLEGTLRHDLRAVDGSLRDMHVYSMLKEEWAERERGT